jgi:hypothetical protein
MVSRERTWRECWRRGAGPRSQQASRVDTVDAESYQIGELAAVYVNTTTDLPSFGTVMVDLPIRRRPAFVPLGRTTYAQCSQFFSRNRDSVSGMDGWAS